MDLRPQTPLAMAREIVPKDPVCLTPLSCLPYLASISDISVDSTSATPQPRTPSPPSSPVFVEIITPGDNRTNDPVSRLDGPTFALDIRKDSPLQVITAEMKFCALSNNAISKNAYFNDARILVNGITHQCKNDPSTDVESAGNNNTANPVNTVHDLLPNSFGSDYPSNSSIMESLREIEEFEWPLPPGPLFRFEDEFSAAADYAEQILQRRMESPVLPLRVVKRNVTPPSCTGPTEDLSSILSEASEYAHDLSTDTDKSDCSTDSHPFFDISSPHLFSEEIITAAYARTERQHKLTDILASLPKEDVITIANLPSGTVVSIEQSDSKGSYEVAYPATEQQALNADQINPHHEENSNHSCSSTPSTRSTSSAPATPLFENLPPMLQRKDDKHSGPLPIEDTIAVLTGEYIRWKTGLDQHDPRFIHMNDADEHVTGHEQWSDALALDGYF